MLHWDRGGVWGTVALLEYRFAGRPLVLWDVRAAIVVDYLPGAIVEVTE